MEMDDIIPTKHCKPILDDTNEVVRLVRELPPVHCLLKIESFSQLQKEHNSLSAKHHFKSAEFSSGGYTWVLSVYPNGNGKKDGNGHISLYVSMVTKLDSRTFVSVALRFFVYDQIRDNYLTIVDLREKRFQAMKNEWGISKVVPLSCFNDGSNGFLVDDCCVLGAEVLVIKAENRASMLSIVKAQSDRRYTWKVEKFSKLKDESYSPEFTIDGWSWKLNIYPTGCGAGKGKSLSLFLSSNNGCDPNHDSKLYVKFILCLKNQLKGTDHQKTANNWFSKGVGEWGYPEFIPLSDVKDVSKGFMVDDVIIVEVDIELMFTLKSMEDSVEQ